MGDCGYRFGQWCINSKQGILKTALTSIHFVVFSFITLLTGIHIPRGAKIGGGFKIWHFGGIVLNPDTMIGENCTIRHGVTIGNRLNDHDVPIIGNNVDIGVGHWCKRSCFMRRAGESYCCWSTGKNYSKRSLRELAN
jgi:serine O-acetyltransferase